MSKVKEKNSKQVTAKDVLNKVRRMRPAGSEKEIIELANKLYPKGKFYYDNNAGEIKYTE